MSATIEAPRGLDTLTPEEQRLMESMRDETPAAEEPAPGASPPPAPAAEETEIEIPDEPESTARTPKKGTMVPHEAMHAERVKRQEQEKIAAATAAELAKVKAERETDRAVLAARLDMIAKVAETQAAPAAPAVPPAEEPLPDENTDPIGYFKALTGKLAKKIETQDAILKGFQEGQQRSQGARDLQNWGISQELAFEAQEPAYRDAMAFYKKSYHEELAEIGVTDPAAREQIIANNVTQAADLARRIGGNFAERLFKAAVKRGFVKAAPVPPSASAADLIAETPAPNLDRATRVAQGRENNLTIGSLGAAPPTRLSVEKIANMSEADFAVFIKRYEGNPEALKDLMGH